ncbi:MAG: hypothetical protein P0Y56_15690 [Candidatus Andeanibacterium colombiense]|uniref:Secreted protein n=1 Tax=Candidatus Andeanibacterium colombiense TaxID=3121345 RepID=A0AAJ5X994_9SPHN|nr:MAG: hypothetical protein P0Y56_15690 [Sphingomonadaceae bacterium]
MDRILASGARFPRFFGRKCALALVGAVVAASVPTSAMAASEASTRVVRCGSQSCLLISGHRDDPSAAVSIAGQAVAVEGKRGWKARVPVDTVRQWCGPYARTIEVSLRDPNTQVETSDSVDLPLGLLGTLTDLAALEISIP